MEGERTLPFCSQPWSTLYIQWDGKLTRPCIRGPQNLGSIESVDLESFWNGPSFAAVRSQVNSEANMSIACNACHKNRTRIIDHLTPLRDGIETFEIDKIDNYYHAIGEYEKAKETLGSKPVALVLDLSSECHMRCTKCFVYTSNLQYHLGHMSMETFEKIIPLLRTAMFVVGHENGESMLNKNFMTFVKIIKENKCCFTFNTTGQLLTKQKSKALVELGVDEIMFSIDSIDSDLYKSMHKNGTLERLMNNLDGLNAAKSEAGSEFPRIGWFFVACKSNISELPSIIKRAAELNFKSMYLSKLNAPGPGQWRSYFDYYREETLTKTEEDRSIFRDALLQARRLTAEQNIRLYSVSAD